MFANSGAEAIENAIKIARYVTGRAGIIAFEHAFHGRTLLAMSHTGKVKPYKYGFGPFLPEIYRLPLRLNGQRSIRTSSSWQNRWPQVCR